jgi:SAM-dependent methyltransferase
MAVMSGTNLTATSDYVEKNRAAWERWAPYYTVAGRRAWADPEQRWGMWGVLESDLGLLRGYGPGLNAIELGCGNGALCAWLARRGMHTVGVDIARAQLDTAAKFQRDFGIDFRLECANAESVPYEGDSFDLAISEYGASMWCDPHRWIPEAARLLRPGGTLVFVVTAPFLMTCTPTAGGSAGERLERPYFGMHRFEFAEDDAVEFHLSHGDWFSVLTQNGLVVENLKEIRPGPDSPPRFDFVSNAWARSWPSEDVWISRRK